MEDTFLNEQVQIYPGDTHTKYGIVRAINDQGVVFEITVGTEFYREGDLHFIAYSANLKFCMRQKG